MREAVRVVRDERLPGPVRRRVSGPAAQPAYDRITHLHGDPDLDRRGVARGRRLWKEGRGRGGNGAGGRRPAVPAAAFDAAVPAEIPTLVVRLEPRAAPLHEPDRRLSRAHERPLPGD